MNGTDLLPPTTRQRIGIVGAGIAGLALALCLRKHGCDPILFEVRSRAALLSEGAFVTLAPNAMNGLGLLDLADAVAAEGIVTTGIEILDERGRRLGYGDQTDFEAAFGAPSVTIARGALMGVLATACEQAGIAVHYESTLSRIDDLGDRIELETGDGERHEVAWLAGCDGLRSQIRKRIFPDGPEPRFSGLIGTGGLARIDAIPSTHGVLRLMFGHVGFFGYLKQDDGPVYWFNSYPASSPDAGRSPSSYTARLRALHRPDADFADAILRQVPEFTRDYPVFDVPPLPAWCRGRIVLAGDAAHAVGPHAGQGAAMAIEDALVLAACMRLETDVAAGFARFEAMRRPRIEEVARITARSQSRKRATTWFDRLVRRLMLPLVLPAGIKAGRALLDYRVDADPRLEAAFNVSTGRGGSGGNSRSQWPRQAQADSIGLRCESHHALAPPISDR